MELRFDDGRVEGLDDGVEVGKWDNPCVVVQHFVGTNNKNFCGQERLFGGKGKNVLDARSRFVEDLVKPTGQKLGGSNRTARNEDPRLDDERNPIGTLKRRGQGGTGREDDRGFGWVAGEPDGASALVVLGLEGSDAVVGGFPVSGGVGGGGLPDAVEVVREGAHGHHLLPKQEGERSVDKEVHCEVEPKGSKDAAHAGPFTAEDGANVGATVCVMEDVEGDRGLAVVHVVQLGGLGPLNEGGVEDGLPFEIVESVDDVVGIVDLAQLEGRVGKPGKTFGASFDPEAELNWRDKSFGTFAGGSFGRVLEGLFEEEGACIDGAVFGRFSAPKGLLVFSRVNFVEHGEVAHCEDERHSLRDVCNGEDVFEAGEGLEWARNPWS